MSGLPRIQKISPEIACVTTRAASLACASEDSTCLTSQDMCRLASLRVPGETGPDVPPLPPFIVQSKNPFRQSLTGGKIGMSKREVSPRGLFCPWARWVGVWPDSEIRPASSLTILDF